MIFLAFAFVFSYPHLRHLQVNKMLQKKTLLRLLAVAVARRLINIKTIVVKIVVALNVIIYKIIFKKI